MNPQLHELMRLECYPSPGSNRQTLGQVHTQNYYYIQLRQSFNEGWQNGVYRKCHLLGGFFFNRQKVKFKKYILASKSFSKPPRFKGWFTPWTMKSDHGRWPFSTSMVRLLKKSIYIAFGFLTRCKLNVDHASKCECVFCFLF